jgi:sugar phosphate isomerase/epimerase
MISRRIFVKHLAAGTGAAWLSDFALAGEPAPARKLKNFGFISGIVGKELKEDWKTTLRKAAGYGFTEMETGNFFGASAQEFLAYCKEVGIKPIGGGGFPLGVDNDALQKRLDVLNQLGGTYAVVYWPWQGSGPFKLEDCKKSVELLNKIGEASKERGLTLCWHNHDKEFAPMESGLPFDYLMAHTDPGLVKCEMDLYWVTKGGASPLEMLRKYKGRYRILHVKDMSRDGSGDFECPGAGRIDFPALFAEAQAQGIRHFMVERDKVTDGLACLQASGQYLQNLRF